jgi:hypothetical protein
VEEWGRPSDDAHTSESMYGAPGRFGVGRCEVDPYSIGSSGRLVFRNRDMGMVTDSEREDEEH